MSEPSGAWGLRLRAGGASARGIDVARETAPQRIGTSAQTVQSVPAVVAPPDKRLHPGAGTPSEAPGDRRDRSILPIFPSAAGAGGGSWGGVASPGAKPGAINGVWRNPVGTY